MQSKKVRTRTFWETEGVLRSFWDGEDETLWLVCEVVAGASDGVGGQGCG